jgi:rhodanese-related sulfurtransferase
MSGARILGATALALGVAAPFAGAAPITERAPGAMDIAALARMVAAQEDHVSALQLARWIRDRRPGLRVIDVRSPEEFARFSIPTAENVPIEQITDARFRDDETIVLYSEGGAHAAQAWVFLKAAGVRNVLFIAGGLGDWFDEVMNPVVPVVPPPGQAAHLAEVAELSTYFGGSPRAAPADGTAVAAAGGDHDTANLIASARRRGC